MFLILTERDGKKYGYYFDFNSERAITFIYKFFNKYKKNKKKIMDFTEERNFFKRTLFSMNYNAIELEEDDMSNIINMNKKLYTFIDRNLLILILYERINK